MVILFLIGFNKFTQSILDNFLGKYLQTSKKFLLFQRNFQFTAL